MAERSYLIIDATAGHSDDPFVISAEPTDPVQEKKNRNRLGRAAFGVANFGIFLLAVYGAVDIGENVYDAALGNGQEGARKQSDIEALREAFGVNGANISRGESDAILGLNFQKARLSLEKLGAYDLNRSRNSETWRFINDQRNLLMADGLLIARSLYPDKVWDVNFGESDLNIDGTVINLKDNFQFIVAEKLIDEYISAGIEPLFVNGKKEAEFEAENRIIELKRLLDLKPPVVFESSTTPFINVEELVMLSRYYHFLVESNYPLPKKIVFTHYDNGDPGAGWYFADSDEVWVSDISNVGTGIHELAHFQADENEEFTQRKFNEVSGTFESELAYIAPEVFLNNWNDSERLFIEDYAETMKAYFVDGVFFRRRLNELRLSGDPAYVVLKVKYDFMKAFFGGKEFLKKGEEFNVQVGSVFQISDPDVKERGVALRKEPGFGDPGAVDGVFDGYNVKVVEEPISVSNGVESHNFYKVVRVNHNGNEIYVFSDEVGWIDEQWLGEIISHADIGEETIVVGTN